MVFEQQRVVVPLLLSVASVTRINLISACYLFILLFYSGLPCPTNIAPGVDRLKWTFRYKLLFALLLVIAAVACVGHVLFQISLMPNGEKSYAENLELGSSSERAWRQIGFTRLDTAWFNVVRLAAVDVIVLAVATWAMFELKLVASARADMPSQLSLVIRRALDSVTVFGVLLLLSGITVPSIMAGIFLVLFATLLCTFSLRLHVYHDIVHGLPGLRKMVAIICAAFLFVLYLYQFEFFQRTSSNLEWVGLFAFIDNDAENADPLDLNVTAHPWTIWVFPCAVFFLFTNSVRPFWQLRKGAVDMWWDHRSERNPSEIDFEQAHMASEQGLGYFFGARPQYYLETGTNLEETDLDFVYQDGIQQLSIQNTYGNPDSAPALSDGILDAAAIQPAAGAVSYSDPDIMPAPEIPPIAGSAAESNVSNRSRAAMARQRGNQLSTHSLEVAVEGNPRASGLLSVPKARPTSARSTSTMSEVGSVGGVSVRSSAAPPSATSRKSGDDPTTTAAAPQEEETPLEDAAHAAMLRVSAFVGKALNPISRSKIFMQAYWASSHVLVLVGMMVWAFQFPSWVGFAMLVWAVVGFFVKRRLFLRTLPALVGLALLTLLLEYIYAVSQSPLQDYDLRQLDLRSRSRTDQTLSLLAKLALLVLFAQVCYNREWLSKQHNTMQHAFAMQLERRRTLASIVAREHAGEAERGLGRHSSAPARLIPVDGSDHPEDIFVVGGNSRTSRVEFDEFGRADATFTSSAAFSPSVANGTKESNTMYTMDTSNDDLNDWNSANGSSQSPTASRKSLWALFCKQAWRGLSLLGRGLWELFAKYAYVVTLMLIYFASLEEISITNAIYMILSIIFGASRHLGRKYWFAMVAYAGVVMVIEYLWAFPLNTSDNTDDLIGTEPGAKDTQWHTERWHIAIFGLAIIQLYSYRYQARQQKLAKVVEQKSSPASILVEKVIIDFWPVVVALTLLLNGVLPTVDLIALGYLTMLFIGIALLDLSFSHMLRRFWFIVVLYCAATFLAMYLYQFTRVQQAWADILSEQTIKDIGFRNAETQAGRLAYLIGPTIALVVCVTQHTLSHTARDASGEWASTSYSDLVGGRNVARFLTVANFFRRLVVLHAGKLSTLLMFLSATRPRLTLLDFLSLVLVGISLCFSSLKSILLTLMLIYSELLVLVKMLYQLEIIDPDFSSDNLQWAGFVKVSGSASQHVRLYFLTITALIINRGALHAAPYLWNADSIKRMYLFDLHKSDRHTLLHAWLYRINHFMHIYGVEINFSVMVLVSFIHLNAIGFIFLLMLAFEITMPRARLRRIWRIHILTIFSLMIYQYLSAIGLPPSSESLVQRVADDRRKVALFRWLYLEPLDAALRTEKPPPSWSNVEGLTADFFLLLFASIQMRIFYRWLVADRKNREFASRQYFSHLTRGLKHLVQHQGNSEEAQSSFRRDEVYVPDPNLTRAENLWGLLRHHVCTIGIIPSQFAGEVDKERGKVSAVTAAVIKLYPAVVLFFLVLTALSRRDALAIGYLVFAFVFMGNFQNLLSSPDLEWRLRMWRRLQIYNFGVFMLQMVWTLPAAIVAWEEQSGVLIDIVALFGLRYGLDFKLLPSDPRIGVWDPTGHGFEILLFMLLQFQLHMLHSWECKEIARLHRMHLSMAKDRGKMVADRLVEASRAIKRDQESKLKDAHHILSKLKGRTRGGVWSPQDSELARWFSKSSWSRRFRTIGARGGNKKKSADTQSLSHVPGATSSTAHADTKKNDDFLASLNDTTMTDFGLRHRRPGDDFKPSQGGSVSGHIGDEEEDDNNGKDKKKKQEETFTSRVGDMLKAAMRKLSGVWKTMTLRLKTINDESRRLYIEPEDVEVVPVRVAVPTAQAGSTAASVAGTGVPASTAGSASQPAGSASGLIAVVATPAVGPPAATIAAAPAGGAGAVPPTTTAQNPNDTQSIFSHQLSVTQRPSTSGDDKHEDVSFIEEMAYFVRSHTHWLCYFMLILVPLIHANLLAIVYAIALFSWGALTRPFPSHHFWRFIIGYTEIIIMLKYSFQFDIWGDLNDSNPGCSGNQVYGTSCFSFPKVVGLNRDERTLSFLVSLLPETFLLFSVFLHRMSMKILGIWGLDLRIVATSKKEEQPIAAAAASGATASTYAAAASGDAASASVIVLDGPNERSGPTVVPVVGTSSMPPSMPLASGTTGMPASAYSRLASSSTAANYGGVAGSSLALPASVVQASVSGASQAGSFARIPTVTFFEEDEYYDSEESSDSYDEEFDPDDDDLSAVGDRLREIGAADDIEFASDPEEDRAGRFKFSLRALRGGLRRSKRVLDNLRTTISAVTSEYGASYKDYYIYAFTIEFISFFVIIIGYTAFTAPSSSEVSAAAALQNNEVPPQLLFYMLMQFLIILIDRIIYLMKLMRLKLAFHLVHLILIHILVFFYLPQVTSRPFEDNSVIVFLYLLKIVYFFLSAAQIQAFFPSNILTNVLTTSVSKPYYFVFLCYKAVPFLYELRTLLDWTCTPTTQEFRAWLKIADISDQLYVNWYRLSVREHSKRRHGESRNTFEKILLGAGLICLLLLILWFPLLLMALIQGQTIANVPIFMTATVSINDLPPVYQMAITAERVNGALSEAEVNQLRSMQSGFNGYKDEDIKRYILTRSSNAAWIVSELAFSQLEETARQGGDVSVRFAWQFKRQTGLEGVEPLSTGETLTPLDETAVANLRKALSGSQGENDENVWIEVPKVFPRFFALDKTGVSGRVTSEMNSIRIRRLAEVWQMEQLDAHVITRESEAAEAAEFIIASERVLKPSLSFLAATGIVGLYVSVVLVIGRLVRMLMFQMSRNIIYEDMPQIVTILNLVQGIFLAREFKSLSVEEDLSGLLIQLYRSPESLVMWSDPNLLNPT
eukprot:m.134365 g.134365  ORF g.134365 m.134365 type:complete len:2878 (-) comp9869_c0_seq1:74-8707(-)